MVAPGLGDDVLKSLPPVVVKTIPAAGADDVDPKLTEIQVTFSKDMLDDSWSWVRQSEETMPKLDGKPKYLKDKRTCVLPVKLEPGHTYVLWINSTEFQNFVGEDKHPAVPYLLAFRTKGTSKTPSPSVAFNEETLGSRFDDLWSAMDRQYSYFTIKKDVDWAKQKTAYRAKAIKAKDVNEFVAVLVDMLTPLKDLHVWIETPSGIVPTYKSSYERNWNRSATLKIIDTSTDSGFAIVGKTKEDGFGTFSWSIKARLMMTGCAERVMPSLD
jgi:RNA polymerase sigma-70 factor (ECF subfamily)